MNLLPGKVLATLFFQPSTRTRLSFETAMHRLGGAVITETTPLISSSAAKEESLDDMLTVVAKYANVIVLRHFDDVEAPQSRRCQRARRSSAAASASGSTRRRRFWTFTPSGAPMAAIEGLKVCIASTDLDHARTGHSMAYGLARLGAKVTLASPKSARTPDEVLAKIASLGASVTEEFDLEQDSFNELIYDMDLVYLPGCSAPKGPEADAFKTTMDKYLVRYETLQRAAGRRADDLCRPTPCPARRRDGSADRLDSERALLQGNRLQRLDPNGSSCRAIAGLEEEPPGSRHGGPTVSEISISSSGRHE